MKYKLKFEIVYPDMDKQELRDTKISDLFDKDDIITELESDEPIMGINVDTKVVLGGVDHLVKEIVYGIEKNCFVRIHRVVNCELQKAHENKKAREEIERMHNMVSSSFSSKSSSSRKFFC